MSTHADVAIDQQGSWTVARVIGEVDLTNAPLVRDELTAAVPNDSAGLIVDLSDTRYLDSAAIEVLFELSTRLDHRRQRLQLVVPPGSPLGRLLNLTGVEVVARIHETIGSALGG